MRCGGRQSSAAISNTGRSGLTHVARATAPAAIAAAKLVPERTTYPESVPAPGMSSPGANIILQPRLGSGQNREILPRQSRDAVTRASGQQHCVASGAPERLPTGRITAEPAATAVQIDSRSGLHSQYSGWRISIPKTMVWQFACKAKLTAPASVFATSRVTTLPVNISSVTTAKLNIVQREQIAITRPEFRSASLATRIDALNVACSPARTDRESPVFEIRQPWKVECVKFTGPSMSAILHEALPCAWAHKSMSPACRSTKLRSSCRIQYGRRMCGRRIAPGLNSARATSPIVDKTAQFSHFVANDSCSVEHE